jgi:hypothetical protein
MPGAINQRAPVAIGQIPQLESTPSQHLKKPFKIVVGLKTQDNLTSVFASQSNLYMSSQQLLKLGLQSLNVAGLFQHFL